MENRGLIAAVCSGRPSQQMLRFHMQNKQCFQLSALPASTAQRWFRRMVITYQMRAPWNQNHVPLEWRWVWLTLYRVNLTIGTPVFIWGSAPWKGLGSLKGACAIGFVGMSEGSGLSETFASVLMTLSTALYICIFFSSFHFHIFNKGK